MIAPHYTDGPVTLYAGDCIEVMRQLPDASVDSVVTDPPYGLEFMGRDWDGADGFRRSLNAADVGRESTFGRRSDKAPEYRAGKLFQDWCELWATEALRVLKPGGHLLAFGGTRTFHRLTAGIEDAGFEIRDSIAWLYGSGFPKSLDVSKAIDKTAGAEPVVLGPDEYRRARANRGTTSEIQPSYDKPRLAQAEANLTAPATDAAREWAGWGTALKPAFEPIVVARKPLVGTVAANVLTYGTGALNIDGARIGTTDILTGSGSPPLKFSGTNARPFHETAEPRGVNQNPAGRWPANVVLDASQAAALDQQSGVLHTQKPTVPATMKSSHWGGGQPSTRQIQRDDGDATGASRFFYTAKAPGHERPEYWTPTCDCETVKPCPSPQRDTTESTSDAEQSWNTSTSGNSTTADQSLPVTTSTTATTTNSTTASTTSNSSRSWNTNASTPDANSATANGGSPAASADSSSPSPSTTGTSASKGGPYTADAVPATSAKSWNPNACAVCGAPHKRESHATVKPLDLMQWLVRLVTPKGGTVLEPFAGSGTTVEACLREGFSCIAIERETDYLPLILKRVRKDHAVGFDFGDWDGAA